VNATEQNVMIQQQSILEVNNLSHRFAKRGVVLDSIDFNVKLGDRLALVGANGAGKTTLLHLLVGIEAMQSGEIKLQGANIKTEADFVRLRQQVGLVFQDADDQLFCPSVLEDIMFGPLNQGMSVTQAQQAAQAMLSQMNLSHLSDRMASELSGGEKRMITLASVLVMQPQLILLDEPTNALDSQARESLLRLLQSLSQAMLIISHDQDFLDQLANATLTLKDGVLSKSS
jgi:cobalt/nickel transport system ATP-binding protein